MECLKSKWILRCGYVCIFLVITNWIFALTGVTETRASNIVLAKDIASDSIKHVDAKILTVSDMTMIIGGGCHDDCVTTRSCGTLDECVPIELAGSIRKIYNGSNFKNCLWVFFPPQGGCEDDDLHLCGYWFIYSERGCTGDITASGPYCNPACDGTSQACGG